MAEWEAPAKINLDLRVGSADGTGRHPLRSLVQTVEWSDVLDVEVGDEDHLEVTGPARDGIPDGGSNLVWKAVEGLELGSRPPFHVRIDKQVPAAAGLGGGSSDAAAMLSAAADLLGLPDEKVSAAAQQVGADVPLFLVGGTVVIEGYGERVQAVAAFSGFAIAVAVPPFELATADVYGRWDALDGPVGDELPASSLPPSIRSEGPFRNDLTPAALACRAELADWIADLESRWGRSAMMSGSGPACFAYFLDFDEAESAVAELREHRGAAAARLRPRGVARRG